jgi:SAM-dependent methyltransferase
MEALPETDRLATLSPEDWRTLGQRLKAIGYAAEASDPIRTLLSHAVNPQRAPMAKWHARRVTEPWGPALRMLLLSDPVTEAEATAVLGEGLPLQWLLSAGLLVRTADGMLVSPYVTSVAGKKVFLCDHLSSGEEAVMGPSLTTLQLVRASRPTRRAKSALDVGCGAGTAAILLAPDCDRVVATDISARAVDLARVNVWMNDVGNVDVRLGDLFAPVEGETFDLVVAQPPCLAHPPDSPATTFLVGGSRGDELALRMLRELRPHLAPGGTAVMLMEWPILEGDLPLPDRLGHALEAGDASLLVVLAESPDVRDDHCKHYATLLEPSMGEAWEREAIRRRDHFERLDLRELRSSLTVVRRSWDGVAGWISVVPSRRFASARITRQRLDAMIAARDLDATGTQALRVARLRVADSVTFTQRSGRFFATFGEDGIGEDMVLDENAMALLQGVHTSRTVGEALDSLAARFGQPEVADEGLAVVQNALLAGLLEAG